MLPYNYGIHYDMSVGERATANVQKELNQGSPLKSAIEIHLRVDSFGSDYVFQRFAGNPSDSVAIRSDIDTVDPGGDGFDTNPITAGFWRFRIEKDYGTGAISIEIANDDTSYFVDVSSSPTTSIANKLSYFGWSSTNKVALIRAEKDFGSGWEDFINVDPNLVPATGGGYTQRGSVDAVSNSTNRIYDTVDGNYFDIENVDVAGTFPAIYNIVSINGETETPTVVLGEDFDVVMSNSINPDSVTMDDGNQTYVFDINTVGNTTTCSLPLTSDDTLPKFGTVTISVVKGSDTYTKDVTFAEPAGYTRVDLDDPIELDESSYTFGTGLSPVATDTYFYQPTTDFSITENNVLEPQGDAPWQHTVWYLSGAGLYRTTLNSGYGVIVGTPPVANAGNDQVGVEAGELVQLDSSSSTDDNAIVSRVWTQTAGDTVTLSDDTAVSPTFTAPTTDSDQTLTFSVLVTDGDGATDNDSVNIGVLAEVVVPPDPDSTLTLEVDGIGSGLRSVVIHDRSTRDVLFDGQMTFSNDVGSVTLTGIPTGTEVYGAYFGVDPDNDGTGLYGSTE